MGKRTEARLAAKEKALPILEAIDRQSALFATDGERRKFLQKLAVAIYRRRQPLYPKGLHPNQKA